MLTNTYSKSNLIADLKEIVNSAVATDPANDQQTMTSKQPREHTLEEIGQELGVTRERVRQIEAKAISKLKRLARCKVLEPFDEDGF